jgi:hypothetical protein
MLVDREETYRGLKFGDIKRETESLIVAAQDHANVDCVRNMMKPLTI